MASKIKNRVIYVKYLPIVRGLCLPHIGIIIKNKYRNDKALIQHEEIHLQQIKRMSFPVYALRYIIQFLIIGYDTMPLEMEARQNDESPYNYRKNNWKK